MAFSKEQIEYLHNTGKCQIGLTINRMEVQHKKTIIDRSQNNARE